MVGETDARSEMVAEFMNFRARSHWYFEQASQLTAQAISLRYASHPDLEAYAEKRATLR